MEVFKGKCSAFVFFSPVARHGPFLPRAEGLLQRGRDLAKVPPQESRIQVIC